MALFISSRSGSDGKGKAVVVRGEDRADFRDRKLGVVVVVILQLGRGAHQGRNFSLDQTLNGGLEGGIFVAFDGVLPQIEDRRGVLYHADRMPGQILRSSDMPAKTLHRHRAGDAGCHIGDDDHAEDGPDAHDDAAKPAAEALVGAFAQRQRDHIIEGLGEGVAVSFGEIRVVFALEPRDEQRAHDDRSQEIPEGFKVPPVVDVGKDAGKRVRARIAYHDVQAGAEVRLGKLHLSLEDAQDAEIAHDHIGLLLVQGRQGVEFALVFCVLKSPPVMGGNVFPDFDGVSRESIVVIADDKGNISATATLIGGFAGTASCDQTTGAALHRRNANNNFLTTF